MSSGTIKPVHRRIWHSRKAEPKASAVRVKCCFALNNGQAAGDESCDRISLVAKRLNSDVTVYRCPAAKNGYNKAGICLAGLKRAMLPPRPREAIGIDGSRGIVCQTDFEHTEQKIAVGEIDVIDLHPALYNHAVTACRNPADLLDPDDEFLARQIYSWPILLLSSPKHRDALCRWTYAVRMKAKGKAADYKHLATVGRTGRPDKVSINGDQFKQVMKDMKKYAESLHRCIKASKSLADVMTYFSDLCSLKEFTATLQAAFDKPKGLHLPSKGKVKEAVFKGVANLGKTEMNRRLSQIKSNNPSPS